MAVDDEIVDVQINGTSIPAMLDTGSYKTILRNDKYVKIGSPTLNRPRVRSEDLETHEARRMASLVPN